MKASTGGMGRSAHRFLPLIFVLAAASCAGPSGPSAGAGAAAGGRAHALIPAPREARFEGAPFPLGAASRIFFTAGPPDASAREAADLLLDGLREAGVAATAHPWTGEGASSGAILLLLAPAAAGPGGRENYALRVGSSVTLAAYSPLGLLRGVQTLLQLVDRSTTPPSLPGCVISDAPAYSWRGLMLDPARTFLDLDFLRRTIRVMSAHKMNILHLHLTDDQPWRFESKAYPKLNPPGQPLYTQEELRDLAAFAARLGVEIVPEFDFPGHSASAVNAYPEIDCEGKPRPGNESILCAGKAATWKFLDAVIGEAAAVFPSAYFHIGADEPYAIQRWKSCTDCRARMEREGVADLEGLYHTFLRDVHAIAKRHGKRLVAWEDGIHPGVEPMPPKDLVVHGWKGHKTTEALARAGYSIVNSSYGPMYLSSLGLGEGMSFDEVCRWSPLRFADPQPKRGEARVSFKPLPAGADLLGGQACCWATEQDLLERRLYPRLLAVADALWAGERPDRGPAELRGRIAAGAEARLRALGVPPPESTLGEPIFNGRDLTGWAPVKGAEFGVIDGSIAVTGKGGHGWLRTEKTYGDFALSFEWKAEGEATAPGAVEAFDSGVFFRCAPDGDPWPSPPGYEIQIAREDGGLGLFGLPDAPGKPKRYQPGWNRFELVARGRIVSLTYNGTLAWSTVDAAPREGHIAFQAEGHPIRFRDVRLREIGR